MQTMSITDNSTPSNFYASVLLQAQRHPNAIAAVDGTRDITYAQFVVDIERVTRRLHSLALLPGGRVAIHVQHTYLHWLVAIGLWRAGMLSVSVNNLGEPGLLALLKANVAITEQEVLSFEGGRFVRIGAEWLNSEADSLPPFQEQAFDAGHPVRMILSSGTTGTSKAILLTHRIIETRINNTVSEYRFDSSSRFMSIVGIDTVGGFVFSLAIWSAGGAVAFFKPNLPVDRNIAESKSNLLFMSPMQLSHLVDILPADHSADPRMEVLVAGAILPRAIAMKAHQRLTGAITVVYGSTEAGTVALTREPLEYENPGVCGHVVPGTELQVVNGAGQPVCSGFPGEIRMRGPCCVTAYLDDEATSGVMFRDGWFYPGDTGVLSETGLLSISGRVGDVINLGGVKIAPALIEEVLFACPGVKDVAAFSLEAQDGAVGLWLAVVRGDGYLQDTLISRYQHQFKQSAPNFVHIDMIPRNGMGKVLRNVLRDAVRARLASQPSLPDGNGAEDPRNALEGEVSRHRGLAASIVKIDNKDYDYGTLPDEAKSQLASLRFVDAELQRLNAQAAVLQTARMAHAKALSEALGAMGGESVKFQ
ncbi:MAG: AMP-binding protein [Burkholderiales bacterium]